MVKLVDTTDLKSVVLLDVPVQVRLRVLFQISEKMGKREWFHIRRWAEKREKEKSKDHEDLPVIEDLQNPSDLINISSNIKLNNSGSDCEKDSSV